MLLYIDPGTGSMLFTILIAVIGSLIYLMRGLKVRMGSLLNRNKAKEAEEGQLPLVFFSDHKRYWNIFEPILDELDRRGVDAVFMTESQDDPGLSKHYEHIQSEWIGEGNKAYARLSFLKARMLAATTPGLEVYQWKRSRDIPFYVHLSHGCNDPIMYRMFGLDYYDSVLLSGEYQVEQIRKLEQMRGLPAKELEIVGIPYMDEMRARLAEADRQEEKKEGGKTVLLAPSWGKSGILSVFGSDILDALLATGYHIIVRPHPQSYTSEKEMLEGLMAKYPADDRLEWNRDNDNFEVLRRSDILISDFSGVLFDFTLVFDKPIIYTDTSYDRGPYDAWWSKEPLWTFETLPKLGLQLTRENFGQLKELIDRCIDDPVFKAGRDQARRETWMHPGEGTQRTVDYLLKKLAELEDAGQNNQAPQG